MAPALVLTALSALVFLASCSKTVEDVHPQKLVSKRQAVFKNMTKTLEPMGLVARGHQDYVKPSFAEQAQAFRRLSDEPWPLFTPDSLYPPTRAKPEALSQPAEFKQAIDHYLRTVDRLVEVSESADMAAIAGAVDAIEKSCKSCHERFRTGR